MKIKVNKDTCIAYAKAMGLGAVAGFSMTYTGIVGVSLAIIVPGWGNKIAAGAAVLGSEVLMAKGYYTAVEELIADTSGLDPLPIRFIDPDKEFAF